MAGVAAPPPAILKKPARLQALRVFLLFPTRIPTHTAPKNERSERGIPLVCCAAHLAMRPKPSGRRFISPSRCRSNLQQCSLAPVGHNSKLFGSKLRAIKHQAPEHSGAFFHVCAAAWWPEARTPCAQRSSCPGCSCLSRPPDLSAEPAAALRHHQA